MPLLAPCVPCEESIIASILPYLCSDAPCRRRRRARALERQGSSRSERLAMQSSGWAPPPSQVRLLRAVRLAPRLSHTALRRRRGWRSQAGHRRLCLLVR